jgi:hypothetical protein
VTHDEADRLVREALRQLKEEQPELFHLDVSERALTHHLANCILKLVPKSLNVDVEYNRHCSDPKRLTLPRRDASDRELRATTVFPDIIVHVRDTDKSNLVVLEVKKKGEPLEYDSKKLRAFRAELGYCHAGHVIVGVDADGGATAELEWLNG